ncbi:MAG: DUF4169 family protein [Pseudomonadota bacterium]
MTVVNLNKARKAKARVTARAKADANAVKFGRTKAQKTAEAAEEARARAAIDGARREDAPRK